MEYKSDHTRIIDLEEYMALLQLKVARIIEYNGLAVKPKSDLPEIIAVPPSSIPETLQPVQRLQNLVEPMDRKAIRRRTVSVKGNSPLRVFAGKDDCQWMYAGILKILDATMQYVCDVFPRENNNAFVLGDAGCRRGRSCLGHAGAHDNRHTIDLNYCTLSGFNMTHYRIHDMPTKYMGPNVYFGNVHFRKDGSLHQYLNPKLFDVEKNYALYYMLKKIFPESQLLTSNGINNFFKQTYGKSVLQGDDILRHNHHRHVHLCLNYRDINWDAEFRLDYRE